MGSEPRGGRCSPPRSGRRRGASPNPAYRSWAGTAPAEKVGLQAERIDQGEHPPHGGRRRGYRCAPVGRRAEGPPPLAARPLLRSPRRPPGRNRPGTGRDGARGMMTEGLRTVGSVLDSPRAARRFRPRPDWPPDVFAITAALLNETETFLLVVSLPEGRMWPPTPRWAAWSGKRGRLGPAGSGRRPPPGPSCWPTAGAVSEVRATCPSAS